MEFDIELTFSKETPFPSKQICMHSDAFIIMPDQGEKYKKMLVLGSEKEILPHTTVGTNRWQTRKFFEKEDLNFDELPTLEGSWLFGGLIRRHVGHVVTNSLGRLWALNFLPADTKILFVAHRFDKTTSKHFENISKALGVSNTHLVVQSSAKIETLYTVPEIFGEQNKCHQDDVFSFWLRQQLPPPRTETGKRIYITRARLKDDSGRILCEEFLEKNLLKSNYEIFAPEKHSFREQLEQYAMADHIVLTEGTPLHIAIYAMRKNTRLTVIQRRSKISPLIDGHINSVSGNRATIVNCIAQIWRRDDRGGDYRDLAEIDFELLQDHLINAGAIPRSSIWTIPSRKQMLKSRDKVAEKPYHYKKILIGDHQLCLPNRNSTI